MKLKRKLLSLLAVVCITAGCSGNAVADKTNTEALTDSTTSTENSEQPLFQKEFEITDWTMEDLVADMTICGKKVGLPCTISDLSDSFEIEEFDHISGATGKRTKGCEIYHNNIKIAFAYCDVEEDDNVITSICFDEIIRDNAQIPEINIMGITDKASPTDVVAILGEPNVNTEYDYDYRYYFSNNQHLYISFNDDETEIMYLAIEFKKK